MDAARAVRLLFPAALGLLAPTMAGAAEAVQGAASPPRDPLTYETADTRLKLDLEAGVQAVGESRVFWNLSRVFAPTTPFKTTMNWGEAYLKPGFTLEHRFGGDISVYGGASVVAAYSVGRDLFDVRDKGRVLLETAYAGLRYGTAGKGFHADFSFGAQPYRVGSGMLIADGSNDGFERGALIFGPRSAWAQTVIARAGYDAFSVEGFYLDPNEYAQNDSRTRLAGINARYASDKARMISIAYGRVLGSEAPYPQAAPGGVGAPAILLNARDDLNVINAYGRWAPLSDLPDLWIAGDLAYQWNTRIDMRATAGRAEVGYAFKALPFAPTLTYAWQTFSGDNPHTSRLERFDPLFYDGSPNGWATGTNGSFVFINSNVNAHRATLALNLSPQDFLTFRYAHVRANQLNSPIQFGQATRLTYANGIPGLIAGVRSAHLADDVMAEYTRVVTRNAFLTLGVAYSMPGAGLKDLAPGRLKSWGGAFANLVVRY